MKRADAFALVRRQGGTPREGVTKRTGVLIVGELGWPLLDDGRPSNSLAQAKSYRVPIASERQFLEWLGRSISGDRQDPGSEPGWRVRASGSLSRARRAPHRAGQAR